MVISINSELNTHSTHDLNFKLCGFSKCHASHAANVYFNSTITGYTYIEKKTLIRYIHIFCYLSTGSYKLYSLA